MVNVVPSALTAVTLLKVSSLVPPTWYLIIVPIGISVNTFPGLFSVLPPLIVPPLHYLVNQMFLKNYLL